MAGDRQIEIVPAQAGVSARGEHLEHAVLDPQERYVERAAAQVVDRDDAAVSLMKAIGERGRRGFVDDAEHFQARELSCVFRRLALRVVEIRRNRDHRPENGPAERFLRPGFQAPEHQGADLGRAVGAPLRQHVDDFPLIGVRVEGQVTQVVFYVFIAPAHEPLDGKYGVPAVGDALIVRLIAGEYAVGAKAHHGGHDAALALGREYRRLSPRYGSDQAVRRAQVDPDDVAHSLSSRARLRLARVFSM